MCWQLNGDGIFPRLMLAIDRPDLVEDAGLQTNAGRWQRRDELGEATGEWCAQRSVEDVVGALEEVGVPAGPIYAAEDLVADEQLAARGMIQNLDVSTGEEVLENVAFTGITQLIGGESIAIDHLGPDLGEHTDEVLSWLRLRAESDQ
ncbi:CoA transferase [Brevibacterium sp. FAM 27836]|uniref:CoA transferase n=1 Tax=Brevibacterium sp. FAM 27836 TaxID=3446693 RepID=UPI003F516937